MVQFSPVHQVHDAVAIVASGESLSSIKIPRLDRAAVIAVNGGHVHCEPDYWFTLDPSPVNIERVSLMSLYVQAFMAVPRDWKAPKHAPLADVHFLERVTGDGHGRYRTRAGIAPYKDQIYTGNSGVAAIQLAAHMGAKRICLFGFDGTGPYADNSGSARDLSPMPDLCEGLKYDLIARGIEVLNTTPFDVITTWPRVSIEDGIRWINR
jgi:hypothetical protein